MKPNQKKIKLDDTTVIVDEDDEDIVKDKVKDEVDTSTILIDVVEQHGWKEYAQVVIMNTDRDWLDEDIRESIKQMGELADRYVELCKALEHTTLSLHHDE